MLLSYFRKIKLYYKSWSDMAELKLWFICTTLCISYLFSNVDGAKKNKQLQIEKEFVPEECNEVADVGDEVHVQYTGYLETGAVFDSSRQPDRGPLPFVLGQNKVIPGWEQGIKGMCVGERRKLIIPPSLAYGKQGHPPTIPPDATLTFETELIAINKASPDIIFRVLRFFVIPFGAVFVIYYIYSKNRKGTQSKRDGRESMRRKKR